MQVFKTFKIVGQYLRFFFFRMDAWLIAFIVFVGVYSAFFIGAFLLLFLGLKDFISEKVGVVDTGFWLVPQMSSDSAINAGIALLGLSAIFSMVSTYSAAQTAATFGASMIYRFQDRWDNLSADEKKSIMGTAGFSTKYARLVLMSVMPFSVFVLGAIYLVSYNAILGGIILVSGIVALFGFIPVNLLSEQISESKFDADINADDLLKSRRKLLGFLRGHLDMFVARRLIASVNLLLLFIFIAVAFVALGAEFIVSLFNEQSVVVVLLIRASFLSLTRMTICLRVANKKVGIMEDIWRILQKNQLPRNDGELDRQDDD